MLIDLLSNTGYIIVNKEKIKVITYVIALMVRDNIPSNTITRTKLIDIYISCVKTNKLNMKIRIRKLVTLLVIIIKVL